MKRLLIPVVCGQLLAAAAVAGGPDAPRRPSLTGLSARPLALDEGGRLIDAGRFAEAVQTLERLGYGELTVDERVERERLLALAHLAGGDAAASRQALGRLLAARPDAELPGDAPPALRALFTSVRDELRQARARPVTLTLTAPGAVEGDAPVVVEAHLDGLPPGATARLLYRRAGGTPAWSSVDFVRARGSETDFTATVPAWEVPREDAAWQIEYFVEVTDAAKVRLGGRGDRLGPLSFSVAPRPPPAPPPPPPHWARNPWLWAAVGASAVAIGAGVAIVASNPPTATLPIRITIEDLP